MSSLKSFSLALNCCFLRVILKEVCFSKFIKRQKNQESNKETVYLLTLPLVPIFLRRTSLGSFFLIKEALRVCPGCSVSWNHLSLNKLHFCPLFSNHFPVSCFHMWLCPLLMWFMVSYFTCQLPLLPRLIWRCLLFFPFIAKYKIVEKSSFNLHRWVNI